MPLLTKRAQQRVSRAVSLPAPTGGINDIDPLATMGPEFCLSMDNWFPNNASVTARRGYQLWCSGLPAAVDTVIPVYLTDGEQKLFAACNQGLYDVSVSTTNPPKVADLSYGGCTFAQFSNTAGQWLVVCNGTDPALLYNGNTDTWTTFTQSGTPTSPGEISGVDPATLNGVLAYKNRLWFVQQDTLTAYYLDIDAISGTANPFYLGGVFQRGGALAFLATWSFDSGNGLDDKLIMGSTGGEIAVYAGNDPAQADDWSLEAVFFVAAPIGNRPYVELGGDVILLTRAGLAPISSLVQGRLNAALAESVLSRRISRTLNRIVNGQSFGNNWEMHNVPVLQAVVVIIPESSNAPAQQYVMNILTGAWCRFTLPARCGGLYNKRFFIGDADGNVHVYGTSFYDAVEMDGSGGIPVQCSLFSSFNYLGDPTTNKHFKLVRPIIQSTQPPSYLARVNVDYNLEILPGNPNAPGQSTVDALWDTALWDQGYWSSQATVYRPWTGVVGFGFCAALLLKVSSVDETSLAAVEVVYEPGGVV